MAITNHTKQILVEAKTEGDQVYDNIKDSAPEQAGDDIKEVVDLLAQAAQANATALVILQRIAERLAWSGTIPGWYR